MKKLSFLIIMCLIPLVVACQSNTQKKNLPITIWVGAESVAFYQEKANEYLETVFKVQNPGLNHPAIIVKPSDAATAANTFLLDTEEGVDIFTIPSDSLSELVSGSSKIAPIFNSQLLAQIKADNYPNTLDLISLPLSGSTSSSGKEVFGVPYVYQNLVLYYNKKVITDPSSWESILSATPPSSKAFTLAGNDSFSNSFLLMASKNGNFPIRIYRDGRLEDVDLSNAEALKIIKYGQNLFTQGYDPNSMGAWASSVSEEKVLSVIGGAWHFKAASEAFGRNLGISILPTFTIDGETYHSGTFNDVKMFVQRVSSPNANYLQAIMQYFSSIAVQDESFEVCDNLPAYQGAKEKLVGSSDHINLALAQYNMIEYGLNQPFGKNKLMHEYFYNRRAHQIIIDVLMNARNLYITNEAIYNALLMVEKRWKTGE
ncbi:MAG: extracellular solute-binding protein [Acholeplasmatales bacterium]|jgi:arabinogalactan oligomer/maltooligosaccharide transport system substrate-binding protein|nr:extracellular solute-binding protein [Acholeplasmatales bacterium]